MFGLSTERPVLKKCTESVGTGLMKQRCAAALWQATWILRDYIVELSSAQITPVVSECGKCEILQKRQCIFCLYRTYKGSGHLWMICWLLLTSKYLILIQSSLLNKMTLTKPCQLSGSLNRRCSKQNKTMNLLIYKIESTRKS